MNRTEALSDRQVRALAHRSRQRENVGSEFARGVNDTTDHVAAALRSFEGDLHGLAGHLRARVRGGTRWEKSAYEDGVAAVLDDVAGILDNDSDTIGAVIYRGRTQFTAKKES